MDLQQDSAAHAGADHREKANPFELDPRQWDQETRNMAALGDLHSMIDRHVLETGMLPGPDMVNGFADELGERWGKNRNAENGETPSNAVEAE